MSIRVRRVMGHSFVASALPADSVVVDLGGNCGAFSCTLVRELGVRCHVYEPNPAMHSQIPALSGLSKHRAAATTADGPVLFHIDANPEASSLLLDTNRDRAAPVTVDGRSLATILSNFGQDRIALLKVDIEGAEIGVFEAAADDVLLRCDQISVEFHELFGWTKIDEIQKLRQRLRGLGFRSVVMSASHYGDVLFVNTARFGTLRTFAMLAACIAFKGARIASTGAVMVLQCAGGSREQAARGKPE